MPRLLLMIAALTLTGCASVTPPPSCSDSAEGMRPINDYHRVYESRQTASEQTQGEGHVR